MKLAVGFHSHNEIKTSIVVIFDETSDQFPVDVCEVRGLPRNSMSALV